MNFEKINETMNSYLDNQEIACAALIVRKDEKVVYMNKWGFADAKQKKAVEYDSIFRMMSMTKPIIAVGIMQLAEQGKLSINDPITKFIPAFSQIRVSKDIRFLNNPRLTLDDVSNMAATFNPEELAVELPERDITLRDILSHSSGLGQGPASMLYMMKKQNSSKNLAEHADYFAHSVLDFQPGKGTGYSAAVGFDILTRVIEVVSNMPAAEYLKKMIFEPLDMQDSCFILNDEQQSRLVSIWKRENSILVDVTEACDNAANSFKAHVEYISGSGGLFSTILDYEHFARMLCDKGLYNGRRFLKPETVEAMHTEASVQHMEFAPGQKWGIGMRIVDDPQKSGSFVKAGTYGWSGAYGTHFFISPSDNLECVLVVNRIDLNGAGSYISMKIEELVFDVDNLCC
ncbi:MAG: serine hydrolase domain-containing protein [Clostridiaceae bacterium]|nr:serine hydrolase domain-containing protein [Clostridiaceae bacterium]